MYETGSVSEKRAAGQRGAGLLLEIKEERIDDAISAILILNTVANTLGATMAGAHCVQLVSALLIHGADHERGWRAGTENVLEVVGLGKACEVVSQKLEQRAEHMRILRDRLHDDITAKLGDVRLNGHTELRLPNTLSLSFPGIEAQAILSEHLSPERAEELAQVLSEWLAVRTFLYRSDQHRAFFISKKGNRLAIRTMEDNLKKLLQRAALKVPFKVTCHSLRHSMASHLNDKGTDILVIQSILGHTTTRSTEPYIHPSADRVRKALEKLPAIKFVKELIRSGELDLCFQTPVKIKKE